MKISETKGNTEILVSKSTRDLVMSDKIPLDSGISNTPSTIYVVGRPGSGKSHFLESYMRRQMRIGSDKSKQTCFDSIYVVAPESSQGSYEKSFVCDCDPEKVYDELNIANLTEIYDGCCETKELGDDKKKNDNYFSCVLIDDCATEMRDKHVRKLLLKMLRNHRHIHTTIILVSQNYMSMDKNCRDCVRQLVQFNTCNHKEKERIAVEWLGQFRPKEFEILWEYLFRDKYQFLMCDRKTDEIHKTFNKIDVSGIERGSEDNHQCKDSK